MCLFQKFSLPTPGLSEHQKTEMGVGGGCEKGGPSVCAKPRRVTFQGRALGCIR